MELQLYLKAYSNPLVQDIKVDVRYKKTERFISAPAVPDKLMSCTLALKHVEVVMNKCFATSSDCGKQEGALTFVKKSSPALKCLRSLCEVLRDSGER